MKLTTHALLASFFASCSLAQIFAPSLTCPKGYSATTGSGPGGVCATGQDQNACIASICTSAINGKCVTANNNLYCSACCVNTDYFIFPVITQTGTATYNIGDTLDVIYISNTATPNGISTNCTCNNPPGQSYSSFNNTVTYGQYNGADDLGTSVGFNQSIQSSCSQLKTLCYLQLHAFDGMGPNEWGTTLAQTYDFNLAFNPGGSVVGSLPIVQSTTTTAAPTITSASITILPAGGAQTTLTTTTTISIAMATASPVPVTSNNSISAGAIAGIVVGGLAGLVIIGLIAYLLWRREMRKTPRVPERIMVSDPYEPHMQQNIQPQPQQGPKPYGQTQYRSELAGPTPEMEGARPDVTPELMGSSPRTHYSDRFNA